MVAVRFDPQPLQKFRPARPGHCVLVPNPHRSQRLLRQEGKSYYRHVQMLMFLLTRILTLLTILWVLRFLWRILTGSRTPTRASRSARPKPIVGELKQDPNCGTYISADISLKTRLGNEVLYFCSRKCQEEFQRTRSEISD